MPISPDVLLGFILTSLIIELTPGPNMAYLAIISLTGGRRAGYAATAGIALGLMLVGMAAALGLGVIIAQSAVLYEGLRWTGVIYLLWLAWDGWRNATETSPGRTAAPLDASSYFRRGLITNLLNPKAAFFFVAVLPAFIDNPAAAAAQASILSLLYVAIATAIHATIVTLAASLTKHLSGEQRIVRRALSAALAVIAIWFAFSTAR